ncbi:MerR family transcriptional regulator [Falsibacillus pallidus]|uniref:Chromosome-anchoring protein RacA n=1 Tax=Falsibacillus pallidus TaxID=493781 RepID=A0A370G7K1_9BACI|nr:MerR family transcriptional regulator [Falsibacillus pallidus]RDI38504.1 chromosome-anchoring protein RacA [Falsibacillus pallidus]
MNTSYVANLLGVSPSTVQRWIKQLDLEMERNEIGHYSFTEDDVAVFKTIHKQLQNGVILQDVKLAKMNKRKGSAVVVKKETEAADSQKILQRLSSLEQLVQNKADSVVSYQLLTHRREIEELEKEVKRLQERVEALEKAHPGSRKPSSSELPLVLDQEKISMKRRKKNILTLLFGF